jgi:hypothetical protein
MYYASLIRYIYVFMISIYYSWMMHGKRKITPILCPYWYSKFNAQLEWKLSISIDCQCFISKMKFYLCCHQSPKRERSKVHLGPKLILVIENNPNKNLIISMNIKQEFWQPKRRKGYPKNRVNSNEEFLKELKRCFKVFIYFWVYEYRTIKRDVWMKWK